MIVVTPSNRPPQIVQLPIQHALEGLPLVATLAAGDLDRESLRFFIPGTLPSGAKLEPATGLFTWTPDFDQAGQHTLRFGVIDASGATDETDVLFEVFNVNRAPVIDEIPATVILVGESYSTTIPGHDPDEDDTVTYSEVGLPSGATLNPNTGALSWTPTGVQVGEHFFSVFASDGELTSRQNLHLVVSLEPIEPDVHIEFTPSFPVAVGQSVLIHATASGVGDVASLEMKINGQVVALDAFGRARFTPTTPGHFAIVATATDTDGTSGQATADLKVRDRTDTTAPVVSLTLPTEGQVLTSAQDVVGSVIDSNLDQFLVQVAPLGSDDWTTLATGTVAATNAVFGRIDPNRFANGAYELRMVATDMSGRSTTLTRTFEVNSSTKVGVFETTATDLAAVLDGIPVNIVRRYSSLDADRPGAFGAAGGWQSRNCKSPAIFRQRGTMPGVCRRIATGRESTSVFLTAAASVFRLLRRSIKRSVRPGTHRIGHPMRAWTSAWTASRPNCARSTGDTSSAIPGWVTTRPTIDSTVPISH